RMTDLLTEAVPVYSKKYGPGGLSTVSLRGTAAVHTTVTWNGLSLASPMAGQTDLSLIPALFADRLAVEYGGASMLSGGGSFGGNLNLTTEPRWNTPLEISVSGLAGRYGLLSGNTVISSGGDKFSYSARILSEKAENNYRYLNYALYPDPVRERRRNAETMMNSVVQEAYWRSDKSVTSAALWVQASDRNLPSSILVSGTGFPENQKDESVRSVINHKIISGEKSFSFTAGVTGERLKYVNGLTSVDSDNKSATYTFKGTNDLKVGGIMGVRFLISEEYSIVRSVNYEGGQKNKNVFSFGSALSSTPGKRSSVTLLVRETALDNKFQIPDFSAGWNYFLTGRRNSWIKTNFSRNSRTPTLNDLYWVPGGNPDLRNEYCNSAEVNTGFRYITDKGLKMSSELTIYSSGIRDMIQWLPGENGYWSPSNIRNVNILGSELNCGISGSSGSASWNLKGYMSYTKSVYMSGGADMKGNQVIYVPVVECNGKAGVKYKSFFGVVDAGYTGRRYITTDNEHYLKPFALVNLETGVDLKKGKQGYIFRLKLENLLDINYELVSYYPMQGFSWYLSFEYRFRK
ncbi:MAG: TonB-dependent receptor, partial [Bacteroidales bacterium]|nr:TonB-dependent receptor [Bacteroidales bacterium]